MQRWLLRTAILVCLSTATLLGYAQDHNGRVIDTWGTLNLRTLPTRTSPVVADLQGGTPLFITGRTSTNAWYQVQTTDGLSGWVSASFVDLLVSQATLPIVTPNSTAPVSVPPVQITQPEVAGNGSATGVVTPNLLNMRAAPSMNAAVLTRLRNGTTVTGNARSADNLWLRVDTALGAGWVVAQYIRLNTDIAALPISADPVSAPVILQAAPSTEGLVTLGGNTWAIYQRGRQLGNQRAVFSKIGDSITVDPAMYTPFAGNNYNLGPYSRLQPTVNTFRSSFGVTSLAAFPGWTTTNLLNPQLADPTVCQPDETPVACELRVRRPAIALVMIGSNDVAFMAPAEYEANLATLVDYIVNQGVVPVLSTIPNRVGYEGGVTTLNQIIRNTASNFGVPLVDYNTALAGLPNQGLSGDGLHPSSPPDGPANSGHFNGEMLQFGYTMRNLVQLQALDAIRRRVF